MTRNSFCTILFFVKNLFTLLSLYLATDEMTSAEAKKNENRWYDRTDPFLGKQVLWREKGWNKCYYCGREIPASLEKRTLYCTGCASNDYCSKECMQLHSIPVHTPQRCQALYHYSHEWKKYPVVVGSDREKGQCLFALRDIDEHQPVFFDEAHLAIIQAENLGIMKLGWMTATEAQVPIKGVPELLTYASHLTVALLEQRPEIVDCGFFSTTPFGEDEEKNTVEAIYSFLSERKAAKERRIKKKIDVQTQKKEMTDVEKIQYEKYRAAMAFGIVLKSVKNILSKTTLEPLVKAFFPLLSTMNHSCNPNCTYYYAGNGLLQVVSIRPIPKGEELCIDYTGSGCILLKEDRNSTINKFYSFYCSCETCKTEDYTDHFESGTILKVCESLALTLLRYGKGEKKIQETMDDLCGQIMKDTGHLLDHPQCASNLLDFMATHLLGQKEELVITEDTMISIGILEEVIREGLGCFPKRPMAFFDIHHKTVFLFLYIAMKFKGYQAKENPGTQRGKEIYQSIQQIKEKLDFYFYKIYSGHRGWLKEYGITHPDRIKWFEDHINVIVEGAKSGMSE